MATTVRHRLRTTCAHLIAVALLSATMALIAVVDDAAPAQAAACPAGTTTRTLTWGASGGIVWNAATQNTGHSQTYTNVGGSGVDMTLTIDDPANMNEDADNALVNLATTDGGWDPPVYTQTDGAYGNGFLTVAMTSLDDTEEVTFTADFSAPVIIGDFSIGDIDYTGNNAGLNIAPHDSFQDEVLISAQRNGVPVAFTGTTGTVGSPTVTLNDAATGQFRVAGGPYDNNADGNLQPDDAAGTVTLETVAPITSFSFAYSNGPDDTLGDAVSLAASPGGVWPAANWLTPMTNTSTGVSNNHAIRINTFTICEGAATIGDLVWADVDGDGVRDPGEPGIADVTVTLYGQDGNPIGASTTTASDGTYEFDQLPYWDYRVVISDIPAGYTHTFDRDSSTASADGDSGTFALASSSLTDADFGLQPPAGTVSGTVFVDQGGDGDLDVADGDTGLGGVDVSLTGTDLAGNAVTRSTTTAADGTYSFTGVNAGAYTVAEAQPTSYTDGIDTPGTNAVADGNDQHAITLDLGDSSTGNDFAEVASGSIAGTVFVDDDNDGTPDGGEAGIGSVTVTLTGTDDGGNAVSRSTSTAGDGTYSFGQLRPGTYMVTETQPGGFLDGIDSAGTSGGDDSSVDDEISAISLALGATATGYDFGEVEAASVSGSVVDDNGVGIENVSVRLTGTDDLGAGVDVTVTTDVDGDYSFSGLRPGTYAVTESQPTGYGDGGETAGSAGGVDSVDDVISGIVLDSGEDSVDNDFDETTGSIAGTVFVDDDNDGTPDAGETGIDNVSIRLTGTDALGGGVDVTVATDVNGDYLFDDLLAGTYTVTETQPVGYLDGLHDAGTAGGDDTTTEDVTSAISLGAGVDAAGYDFGEVEAASISGSVVDDNGVGIENVSVRLTGTDDLGAGVDVTVSTDVDGDYSFTGLRPGTYTVTETQPTGYGDGGQSAGSAGGDDTSTNDVISGIVLDSGEDSIDNDFDETTGSIAGSVVDDDVVGIENVSVRLTGTDALGGAVDVTVATDVNGDYVFDDLLAGTYTVTETQPSAYGDGGQSAGTSGGDDTSANDVISAISLAGGVDATGYDFDETRGSIAGTVFEDLDNDGTPDGGEDGIENVGVRLTGTDVLGGAVDVSVTTGVDGNYVFDDLLAGTYTVTETQPGSYLDGLDDAGSAGGDDTTANDAIAAVSLSGGVDATGYDFGELPPSSLSGTVFVDLDNDGAQEAGENGIENVSIRLTGTDDLGAAVDITVDTDASGDYAFSDLRPGTYTVTETQPGGYLDGIDTAGTAGGDDASANDVVSTISLGVDVDATGYDFGEFVAASISGSVVDDNGVGIENVSVRLTGTDDLGAGVDVAVSTDADGDYSFSGLRPGAYTVTETQPTGYGDGGESAGTAGGDDATTDDAIESIALGVGVDATGYDFDETTGSIAGSVVDDAGSGIEDVSVRLTGTDALGGGVDVTVMTDADGDYVFDDLLAGTYTVTETQPSAYGDGGETAGSAGGVDSVNDVISGIALGGGVDATGYDFAETRGSISGTVFEDLDNDGTPDLGENGIENVGVRLTGTDVLGGAVDASITTGVDGTYVFDDLLAGTYTVTETQPGAYSDGKDDAGSAGGDATVDDVISDIALSGGVAAVGYDFGEIQRSSIGGTVFVDLDNDGAQEADENGIENVMVRLTGTDDLGAAVTMTTTTGADGDYVFGGLRPGTYAVAEIQPADLLDGIDTAGSEGGDAATTNDEISAIALRAFTAADDYDFAEIPPASIAGAVIDDLGRPIGDTEIRLTGTDDRGADVDVTIVTDPDGSYSFDDLRPGTYTVTETQPTGYGDGGESAGSVGGDDATDDTISAIALAPGDDSVNNDFDETTGSISGVVFVDLDNDGVQDPGEAPIADTEVELVGTDALGNDVSVTVTTGPDGGYSFDGLLAGTYSLAESQPADYLDGMDTAGSAGGDDSSIDDEVSAISLGAGVDAMAYDFAEIPPASIAGSVIDDLGRGIPNTTIRLTGTDDRGTDVDITITTNADGDYAFDGLRPGTYSVAETQPTGYGDGAESAGSTGGDDSTDDVVSAVVLTPGVDSLDNDFEEHTGSVAGTVFHDRNGDGVQGADEPALGGVTVTLTGIDELGNEVEITVTTGVDGTYVFEGLLAGVYELFEEQPERYRDGADVAGSAGGDDSQNDTVSAISLAPGVDAVDYDFAELGVDIAGTVWVDADSDGVLDPEEASRLGGVELTLLDADGNIVATTTTEEDGSYLFASLPAGDYTIVQNQPDSYDTTTPNEIEVSVPLAGLSDVDFGEDVSTPTPDPSVTATTTPATPSVVTRLPEAGADSRTMLMWALSIALVGALLVGASRRWRDDGLRI